MGVHHIALATRDAEANHRFYTEAMGFELVKVEVGKMGGGWAKHLFYSTGPARDQLIAFWDLHDETLPEGWTADISRGLGFRAGLNHLAFSADDPEDLARRRVRWLRAGHDVLEIDHVWCRSIYTQDPNGIVVEFCVLTRDLHEGDRAEAERLRLDPHPALSEGGGSRTLHKAADFAEGDA